jgi:hypothetical protein
MRSNTLVYLGHYETSFRKLHADQDHYWTKPKTEDGDPGKRVNPIPEQFRGGIHFGLMQTAGGFIFVRINRLVLPTPVLFIGERHGPKGTWSFVVRDQRGLRDELIRLAAQGLQQSTT